MDNAKAAIGKDDKIKEYNAGTMLVPMQKTLASSQSFVKLIEEYLETTDESRKAELYQLMKRQSQENTGR